VLQKISKEAIKRLYRSRWNVEMDLRNMKTTLGMEHLRCKTPPMALKELWAYLFAYNLIRNVDGTLGVVGRSHTTATEF
jgi:hypothetical protein